MSPEEQSIVAVQVANMDRKLDEVKEQTQKTNGRVTGLEKSVATLKGIGLAFVALSPFFLFALQKFTT